MARHVFGLNICPYCNASANWLTSPTLRLPSEPKTKWWDIFGWFTVESEIEYEHLSVTCKRCQGEFQTRTHQQQYQIDHLRLYNDQACVGCGAALNRTRTGHRMGESISTLHDYSVVTATCPCCRAVWQMHTHERSRERRGEQAQPSPEVLARTDEIDARISEILNSKTSPEIPVDFPQDSKPS